MNLTGEFYYKLLKPIAKKIFYHKFNVHEGDYVLPEEGKPFIVVGHHVSAFDPLILNAFSRRMIRFLYADANNELWVRAKLLRLLDMIPFSKNSADFKSIRQIKNRLKEGQAIGIYPEGGACWDGRTEPLIFSTSKLIKMMNVPVYGIRYNGAYLSKPRWCVETRKGKVTMNTFQIFTKEEIKSLKVEELHEKLTKALEYDEFKWQRENRIPFKGKKLAESIEKLLYYCPECGRMNKMTSKGSKFRCTHCDLELIYNEYGEIILADSGDLYEFQIPEWNMEQGKVLKKLIHSKKESISALNEHIPISHMKMIKKGKIINKNFLFDGTKITSDDGMIMIRLEEIKSESITFNRVISFHYKNIFYTMEFEDHSNLSVKLMYDCITFSKEDCDAS